MSRLSLQAKFNIYMQEGANWKNISCWGGELKATITLQKFFNLFPL